MGEASHLDIVRAGADATALWSREHPGEYLRLAGAALGTANLSGMRLEFADLTGADLSNSDLSGATLSGAVLREANLANAKVSDAMMLFVDLTGATLQETSFDRSNLTGSDLRDCFLQGATFKGAALTGVAVSETAENANFEGARLAYIGLGQRFVLTSAFSSDFLRRLLFEYSKGGVRAVSTFAFMIRGYAAMFGNLIRKGFRAVSWPVARGLGNLTLLTRASYLLLVLVPILAGVWPSLASAILYYDRAIAESIASLKDSQDKLDSLVRLHQENLPPAAAIEVARSIDSLRSNIEGLKERLGGASIQVPVLPRTFAALFFAALFTALGHFLYQMGADPLVKEATRLEYVDRAKSEFDENGPDAPLRLDRARYVIKDAARLYPDDVHPHLVERTGGLAWLPSSSKGVLAAKPYIKLMVVERAAELEYDSAARRAPIAAFFSLSLYLMAVALIVWVLYTQSREVLEATGLLSR